MFSLERTLRPKSPKLKRNPYKACALFVLTIYLSSCGNKFKEDNLAAEKSGKEAEALNHQDAETGVKEEKYIKTIEFDISLKENTLIEADEIKFSPGVKVLTNGFKLELIADQVKFDKNTITSYSNFDSVCNKNGISAGNVLINSLKIIGDVKVNLSGRNAGSHCKLHWSNGDKWCLRFKVRQYFNACNKYYKSIKGYNAGNSGFIWYNYEANIEELNIVTSKQVPSGTPPTRLTYIFDSRTAPQGRYGSKTKLCTKVNGVLVCE